MSVVKQHKIQRDVLGMVTNFAMCKQFSLVFSLKMIYAYSDSGGRRY